MSTSFGQFSIIHGGPESPAIFFTAHIFKMPESICVISINCKSVFLSCCLSTWLWTGLYDFYHGRFWLSLKMISFRGDPDWHSLECIVFVGQNIVDVLGVSSSAENTAIQGILWRPDMIALSICCTALTANFDITFCTVPLQHFLR